MQTKPNVNFLNERRNFKTYSQLEGLQASFINKDTHLVNKEGSCLYQVDN